MELPYDILQLIREFSKPCFKYFREYNRTLLYIGVRSCLELRIYLQYKPERILPLLITIENAHAEFLVVQDDYIREGDPWIIYSKQMEFYSKKENLRESKRKIKRFLCIG